MPKQKITKEMVVDAAFELAREGGMERVQVKPIAARLGCSVQPIYSYCRNMEGLRRDVFGRVRGFVGEYLSRDGGSFQSTGQAYVRLAREEPELFKLFTLCPREGVARLDDLYRTEASPQMANSIAEGLGLEVEAAPFEHDYLYHRPGGHLCRFQSGDSSRGNIYLAGTGLPGIFSTGKGEK